MSISLEHPFLTSSRYGVLGAGLSGLAACRLLLHLGKDVILIDERADAADPRFATLTERGVTLRFGELAGDEDARAALAGCEAVVVSPGVPLNHPLQVAAVAMGLLVRSELELGWLCRGEAKVVGITGTNGKTTVTMLTEMILKDAGRQAVACGNIGLALCDAVLDAGDALDKTIFVVEVSSFQLETIDAFTPDIAMILNITPDHLDRHETMDDYARAKQRLTEGRGASDVLVVNQDDPLCHKIAQTSQARVRKFSLTRPARDGSWIDGDLIYIGVHGQRPRRITGMEELKMIGLHNVANAMAAACACEALGVGRKQIAATLEHFEAAPHRVQDVMTIDGVQFINDSKATNLDAMVRAIDSFNDGVLLIAGGRDKDSPFASVAAKLAPRLRKALLIGEAAETIEQAWTGTIECEMCETLERAMERATELAESGDIVLLSPGCASFDQFKSYADRGQTFIDWVEAFATAKA